jgi:hypothetical protein
MLYIIDTLLVDKILFCNNFTISNFYSQIKLHSFLCTRKARELIEKFYVIL